MQNDNQNNASKAPILVLLVLLGAAIIYSILSTIKINNNKKAFETEKLIKIEELKAVQKDFEILSLENDGNKAEIQQTKQRLQHVIDSVSNLKPDYTLVTKLRQVRDQLKAQLKKIKIENERLRVENTLLATQKDSISTELSQVRVVYDSVSRANESLKVIATKAEKLYINELSAKSVRIKSSGKVVESNRAKRVTGFEVCYTVGKNEVTKFGDKEFFIQLVSPTKKVLGARYAITDPDGRTIKITKLSKFRYDNNMIKICDFAEPLSGEEIVSGTYIINIFDSNKLISSTKQTLR